ncbi:MAG: hypothetical protein Q8O34_00720 [Rhodocyclaceae bacterium]|nr:hypothetical protein [Rhodocyclaceae bacterium]
MLANGIKQATTTVGTSSLALSLVSGFVPFSAKFTTGVNGAPFYYAILDDTTGGGIEWGVGHLTDAVTLSRDKIIATWDGTTYSDVSPTAVSLASGTKRVICSDQAASRPVTPSATDSTLPSPRYLIGGQWNGNSTAGFAMTASMVLTPFRLDVRAIVSGVSVKVIVAATTGTTKNMRAAIYAPNANGHPGALLAETSLGVSTATTGVKACSFDSPIVLIPGWYFVALSTDGNASVSGTNSQGVAGTCPLWGLSGGDPGGRIHQLTKALTYTGAGALFPNPLGTAGLIYGVDWSSVAPCPSLMVTS